MDSITSKENLIHKWDIILVEIFKKEWPTNWTSFVSDLISSCMESESRCINGMYILKIVFEDVTCLSSRFL